MENRNIFIENEEVIDAICSAENTTYNTAISMFTANIMNHKDPERPMYGGQAVIDMADWDALKPILLGASDEQRAEWTKAYYKHIDEK